MRRFVPAPQLLVNRFTISELRRVGWRDIQAFPIQSVSHADANWIDMIQPVKVRNCEFVNPVDHCRVTSCYDVEPAAAALPAGRSSKLSSQFVKPSGELSIFGRQCPLAYARRVRFHHSNYAIHPMRRHARARARAARGRIGGSDVRIRAMVAVQKCALGTSKEHFFPALEGTL